MRNKKDVISNNTILSLRLILVLALLARPAASSRGREINTLNLLLPVLGENDQTKRIEHRLEATNGCFEWKSSHPDLLSIEEIADTDKPGCARVAIASVKTTKEYSNTIWITARDKSESLLIQVRLKW